MYFIKETKIRARPEDVFAFHESPNALTLLIPPWEKMRVVESCGSLHVGSRVVLVGRILGLIPVRWIAEHVEYDPPYLFVDIQRSGPFRTWLHRHRMLDDGQGGTILRDEIEYQLPFGLIGRWLADWLVRRKLNAMFDFRHHKTQQMLELVESTTEPEPSVLPNKRNINHSL